jgi:hypothetical protein
VKWRRRRRIRQWLDCDDDDDDDEDKEMEQEKPTKEEGKDPAVKKEESLRNQNSAGRSKRISDETPR